VIVGTQLVIRGIIFPKLTLVGVIDATFRVPAGVGSPRRRTHVPADASGRRAMQGAEIAGEPVLQTFQPEHPVIRAIFGR
jgi:primosomal protein N' (replication factor Y)